MLLIFPESVVNLHLTMGVLCLTLEEFLQPASKRVFLCPKSGTVH
ncbi:hypothetical protein EAKF1_ch0473c [Escherichia albertii KF1]|nr:hypothetical protein EAKF1_ch0473c [Escherichia albertii KF1]